MKVCILGASGFIGGVLTKQLAANYQIVTPSSTDLDLTNSGLVYTYFENNPVDAVINCAASTNFNEDRFDVYEFQKNISIGSNLLLIQRMIGRLINFGSGAEFDRKRNIFLASEEELWARMPSDHYGLSKNITSRMVNGINHWYNLRLFGVFGPSEHPNRLLKKILKGDQFDVMDRLFDYFYVEDIVPVVRYFLEEPMPKFRDINLTYRKVNRDKSLGAFIETFCSIHRIMNPARIIGKDLDRCYTGSSNKLNNLGLPLIGLEKGLEDYL
jgi:GDP-L-fucose synthase